MRSHRLLWPLFVFAFALLSHAADAHAQVTIARVSGGDFLMDLENVMGSTPQPPEALVGNYEGFRITNTGAAEADVWVQSTGFTGNGGNPRITLSPFEDGIKHIGPLGVGESKMAYFYLVGSADFTTPTESHTINVYDSHPSVGTVIGTTTSVLTATDRGPTGNQMTVDIAQHTPSGPGIGGTLEMTV